LAVFRRFWPKTSISSENELAKHSLGSLRVAAVHYPMLFGLVFTSPCPIQGNERDKDDVFMSQGGAVGYHPKMCGYPDPYDHLLDKKLKLFVTISC
jgi:hypothetical protein